MGTNEMNARDAEALAELEASRYERVLTYMRTKGVSFEEATKYEDKLVALMASGATYDEARRAVDAPRFAAR